MTANRRPIALMITLAEPGGATSFVLDFARWLIVQGEDVVVLVGDQGVWLEQHCREEQIPLIRIPHLRRDIHPWHDTLALWHAYHALHKLNPRAVHLNSSKAGVIGSLAARLARIPRVVYCIAGWATLEADTWAKRLAYLLLERFTRWAKDAVVCLHPKDSAFALQEHLATSQQLHTIPNGIDPELLRQTLLSCTEARNALHLPRNVPVFGTIANFYPAKNLPWLIRAFSGLKQRLPEARLCIIGDGPQRPLLEAALEASPHRSSIHLVGRKDRAFQYLRAFSVFVLPSKKEGMPFVMLEAAAAGLPIVATDVGAHAWMLPEAHIVPAQPSIETWTEACTRALTSPPPDYKTSLERFTREACFQAHRALLQG